MSMVDSGFTVERSPVDDSLGFQTYGYTVRDADGRVTGEYNSVRGIIDGCGEVFSPHAYGVRDKNDSADAAGVLARRLGLTTHYDAVDAIDEGYRFVGGCRGDGTVLMRVNDAGEPVFAVDIGLCVVAGYDYDWLLSDCLTDYAEHYAVNRVYRADDAFCLLDSLVVLASMRVWCSERTRTIAGDNAAHTTRVLPFPVYWDGVVEQSGETLRRCVECLEDYGVGVADDLLERASMVGYDNAVRGAEPYTCNHGVDADCGYPDDGWRTGRADEYITGVYARLPVDWR